MSPISHHLHLWILHEKKKGDIKILEITEQIPLASEEEDKKKAWTVENCGVWNLSARWSWNLRVAYSRRCRRLLAAATPAGGVIWIRAGAHQKPIEIRDRVLWETITTKKKKICCSLSKYIYIFFFPFFSWYLRRVLRDGGVRCRAASTPDRGRPVPFAPYHTQQSPPPTAEDVGASAARERKGEIKYTPLAAMLPYVSFHIYFSLQGYIEIRTAAAAPTASLAP